jgi:hypothetical protein
LNSFTGQHPKVTVPITVLGMLGCIDGPDPAIMA